MATPRELLARTLRQARLDAGYSSHQALARKMLMSRTVVTKAESPSQPVPSAEVLTSWAEATAVSINEFADLAKRAKSGTPEWFMPYASAESLATILRCWNPSIVPGLLQTEAYARAILSVEKYAPEQLDELVSARLERQRVLDRVRFIAVLDHSVPQRMIGSAQVMAEQCEKLVAVAQRPRISLHVVPENTNTGVWCALDIATRDATATVCMTTLRDVTTTAPDLVDDATTAFERILGYAMPCSESIDYLRTWEDKWKAQV